MEEGVLQNMLAYYQKHEVARTFSYAAHNEAYKIHDT